MAAETFVVAGKRLYAGGINVPLGQRRQYWDRPFFDKLSNGPYASKTVRQNGGSWSVVDGVQSIEK